MKLHLPKPLFTAVIAAMALSPTAWGETYDLLNSAAGWTMNKCSISFGENGGITGKGWGGPRTATYQTHESISYLVDANNSFTFTLGYTATTIPDKDGTNNDGVLTFAFAGVNESTTILLGTEYYGSTTISYGTTTDTEKTDYVYSDANGAPGLTAFSNDGGNVTRAENVMYTITGVITLNTNNQYELNLTLADNSGTAQTYTASPVVLGDTFDFNKFILSSNGDTFSMSQFDIDATKVYNLGENCYSTDISGHIKASEATWTSSTGTVDYSNISMADGTATVVLSGKSENNEITFDSGSHLAEIDVITGNVVLKGSGNLIIDSLYADSGATATIGSNMSIGSVYGKVAIAEDAVLSITNTDFTFHTANDFTAPDTKGADLSFLSSATGSGTILLAQGGGIASDMVSDFAGVIELAAGKMLQLSPGSQKDKSPVDISEATIRLNNGSNLWIQGHGIQIGAVDAVDTSTIRIYDGHENNVTTEAGVTIGTLSIASGKTLFIEKNWEGNVHIEVLNASGKLDMNHGGDVTITIEGITKSGNIDNAGQTTLGVAGENSILNIGGTITNSGTLILADGNVTLNVSDISTFQGTIEYDTDKLWDVATQATSETGNGFATKAGYMQVLSNTGTVQVGADAITDFSTIKVTYNGQDATMTEAGKVYGASSKITGTYVIGGEGANATMAWSTIQDAAQTAGIEVEQIQLKDNTTLEVDANANLSADLLNAADTATVNVGESVTVTASGTGVEYNANYIKNMTGTGTMLVNHDTLIGGTNAPLSSEFAGTISVTGGTLHLGATGEAVPVANEINLSKLASIEVTGGKLRYTGGSSTVSKVDIQESSELYIFGTNAGNSYQGTLTLETLNVDNSKKFTIKGHWDFNLSIDKLTGTGAIELSKPENIYDYQANYNIKAVEDGAAISNASVLNLGTSSSSILNMGDVTNSGTLNIKGQLTGTSTISGGTIKLADDVTVKGTVTMATAFAQEAGKMLTVDGGKLTAETATTLNKLVVENSGKATLNGADSTTNINELTIKGSDGLDGSANVKVNNALTIDSQNAFALTGALDLTGATVDLSGFTLDTTLTEQSYSYTLGTAMGGITITETTQLNLAAVDGYTATLAALANPQTRSATETALVLTLTKVEEPVTTLTAMEVTGHAGYNADTNVLTLMTDKDATNATFGDTLAITMADETWNQILAELAELGTTLPEEIRLSFMGADNNVFDFDGGEDNVITPPTTITINGEPGVGENGATVQGDGTVVGSYKTAYIPEPTTSTLSLLALAALAVRRRRR